MVSRATSEDAATTSHSSICGKKKDCIVCCAITNAVTTYLKALESSELQGWPQSHLDLCNQGPYFLDEGAYDKDREQYRVDFSDPESPKVKLIMCLELSFIQGPRNNNQSNRVQEQRTITPQFCLSYSAGNNPRLESIEPWEIPLFDTSFLKKWVHGCEKLHGNVCGDLVQPPGE